MTEFSSKPPFNDDPEPYECNMKAPGDLRHTEKDTWTCVDYSHRPRPEFNRPQHNPTNPILTDFRNLHGETGNDLWTDAYLSWSDLIEQDWGERDEYWHAFSVLGKIVATGKVSR